MSQTSPALKFCRDCKWRVGGNECTHPTDCGINLVTGDRMILRTPRDCYQERESESPYTCGHDAKFFEPKD